MNRPAGIWIGGLVGSVALHVALVAGLLIAIRPDPTVEQQEMRAALDVDAYRLDRQQAAERPAEGPKARQGDSQGASVAEGSVPQSQALESRPRTERLGTQDDAGDPVAAADVTPLPLAPSADRSDALPAARPTGQRATAVTATVDPQSPARLAVETVAPTDIPAAARITSAAAIPIAARITSTLTVPTAVRITSTFAVPNADRIKSAPAGTTVKTTRPAVPNAAAVPEADAAVEQVTKVRPEVETAQAAQPAPFTARSSEPDTKTVKAALAFSGGDGNIDPASLAAFQSFMRPGDAVTEGDPLRDGVAGLLAAVPCSRLQVSFDPATTKLQVNGHVPEDALRAPILAALQNQMGADIGVSDNIQILPRPQCGALAGIAGVGLPQSTDQSTNPLLIGEDTHARVFRFVKNDRLFFDITAPDYGAFIYVDYFDADGNVLHLVPNDQVALTFTAAKSALRVGAETAQDAGLQIRIGPPYGQEIAVAFAASQPLYDGLRPLVEPSGPYLDWLRSRVETARDGNPDFRGEWVYFFVATSER